MYALVIPRLYGFHSLLRYSRIAMEVRGHCSQTSALYTVTSLRVYRVTDGQRMEWEHLTKGGVVVISLKY